MQTRPFGSRTRKLQNSARGETTAIQQMGRVKQPVEGESQAGRQEGEFIVLRVANRLWQTGHNLIERAYDGTQEVRNFSKSSGLRYDSDHHSRIGLSFSPADFQRSDSSLGPLFPSAAGRRF